MWQPLPIRAKRHLRFFIEGSGSKGERERESGDIRTISFTLCMNTFLQLLLLVFPFEWFLRCCCSWIKHWRALEMFVYQLLVPTTLPPSLLSCHIVCPSINNVQLCENPQWTLSWLGFPPAPPPQKDRGTNNDIDGYLSVIGTWWRPCLYISNPRTNSSLSSLNRESSSYSVTLPPARPLCAVQSLQEQEFWLSLITDSKWPVSEGVWSHSHRTKDMLDDDWEKLSI